MVFNKIFSKNFFLIQIFFSLYKDKEALILLNYKLDKTKKSEDLFRIFFKSKVIFN